MKFEPASFYLGVVDFFSIVLPGGLLTYVVYAVFGDGLFAGLPLAPKDEAAKWVAFAFASYLAGHIVFLVGSFLDDLLYNPVRKWFWPKKKDLAFPHATALRKELLGAKRAESINTFQWCKAVLALNAPAVVADVARLEADSKFFRSLVVVLMILFVILARQSTHPALPIALLALTVLAFVRYVERRYKSNEQAFRYVIVLASQRKLRK